MFLQPTFLKKDAVENTQNYRIEIKTAHSTFTIQSLLLLITLKHDDYDNCQKNNTIFN